MACAPAGTGAEPESPEGKGLLAAGIGVAHGEGLCARDLVIDLGDETVDVVLVVNPADQGAGHAVRSCGRGEFIEDCGQCGIGGNRSSADKASLGDGLGIGDLGWRGNQEGKVRGHALALAFVGSEEKRFVLDDGPAEREAELVVAECALADVVSRLIDGAVEEVAGVEQIVAHEREDGAMKLVGAGPGDDVDHGSGVTAVFGGEIRLQV